MPEIQYSNDPELIKQCHLSGQMTAADSVAFGHVCPGCQTIYFKKQECDWCPGKITNRTQVSQDAQLLS